MASVEEQIVREYFEQNGFLVRRIRAQERTGRKRPGAADVQLVVRNPNPPESGRAPAFLVFSSELRYIRQARIVLRSGPNARFTPGALKSGAKLFRFLEKGAAKPPGETADNGPVTKILVVPGLPTAEPFRSRAETLFREKGIDGLISFRSMLLDIIDRVDLAGGEVDSEFLETVRLLKRYELLNASQMELFGGRP